MKYVLLVTTLLSSTAFGAVQKDEACAVKKEARMQSNIIASNIANWNTTRTPEGGPYKRKSLTCKNHVCEIVESVAFTEEYEPDHPDADMAGFVKYPKVDINEEMTAMLKASDAFKEAEKICP